MHIVWHTLQCQYNLYATPILSYSSFYIYVSLSQSSQQLLGYWHLLGLARLYTSFVSLQVQFQPFHSWCLLPNLHYQPLFETSVLAYRCTGTQQSGWPQRCLTLGELHVIVTLTTPEKVHEPHWVWLSSSYSSGCCLWCIIIRGKAIYNIMLLVIYGMHLLTCRWWHCDQLRWVTKFSTAIHECHFTKKYKVWVGVGLVGELKIEIGRKNSLLKFTQNLIRRSHEVLRRNWLEMKFLRVLSTLSGLNEVSK